MPPRSTSNSNREHPEWMMIQQMVNQRLLAGHCFTKERLEQVYYDEIIPSCNSDGNSQQQQQLSPPPPSLIDTIKMCNSKLQSNFGLEIVSVTIPTYRSTATTATTTTTTRATVTTVTEDTDSEEEEEEINHKQTATPPTQIEPPTTYFLLTNQCPDDMAKSVFQPVLFPSATQPTIQNYVKEVLLHLVHIYPTPASRNTILNLKNNNSHNNKNHHRPSDTLSQDAAALPKVSLSNAEDMIEQLIEEHWLMEVTATTINGGGGGGTTTSTTDTGTSNGRRPTNTTTCKIALGPRAYGELSYLFASFLSSSADGADDMEDNQDDATTAETQQQRLLLLPQPIYIRL